MQIVWFRNDLRCRDHAALQSAIAADSTVAVFLWAREQWQNHDVGPARLAFLRRNLAALASELEALNVPFRILEAQRFSAAPDRLLTLAKQLKATVVHAVEEFPLNERRRDSQVARALEAQGTAFCLHPGGAIRNPGSVTKDDGDPYTVFTPFKRRWLSGLNDAERRPLKKPRAQEAVDPLPRLSNDVTDSCLDLNSAFDDVDASLHRSLWPGGESEARRRLDRFTKQRAFAYADARDFAAEPGTSELSPYLSCGALSGRQALAAAISANDGRAANGNPGVDTWISELVWRDFYRHVIVHFPHVSKRRAFKPATDQVAWRSDQEQLRAWQTGTTGYPMVDAGMRQLNATGWMHNRLRMICAMFLSKHLLLDWREGERYFMQQLVDGDFAANNGGWQWSASTGTDAQPYFRVFNPTTQAERFDPHGRFILEWIPELAASAQILTTRKRKAFFEPWQNPTLSPDYPAPIVEHKAARERAIAAFKAL
ncbi:MAG: FAD-binding domain-containing protein [Pseudomonadota bacterium]